MMNYEIWRLELLISVCSVVEIEPLLQEISNEQLSKGADNAADARLDINAGGFWEKQRSAFFYARVCFPNPDMCKDLELSYIYKIHEIKEKRNYAERVNEILHGTFNPLVFTSTGGMSKECKIYHNRLAELIADKKGEQYHTTIAWKNAKTCFSLHRSSLVCLRGSRTFKITTNAINKKDMDIEVEESSIL